MNKIKNEERIMIAQPTTEERIESLQGQINRLRNLVDLLMDHTHADGKVVVPIKFR